MPEHFYILYSIWQCVAYILLHNKLLCSWLLKNTNQVLAMLHIIGYLLMTVRVSKNEFVLKIIKKILVQFFIIFGATNFFYSPD